MAAILDLDFKVCKIIFQRNTSKTLLPNDTISTNGVPLWQGRMMIRLFGPSRKDR